MRFAVIGERGLLGSALVSRLAQVSDYAFVAFNRNTLDLDQSQSGLNHELAAFDVIINCAAFTNVDEAESCRDQAFLVNETYAEKLAIASANAGAHIFHVSTDYVFDGVTVSPYKVNAEPNPINVYGESKLAGEIAVAKSGSQNTIVRTAWLYGASRRTFPQAIHEKVIAGEVLEVVSDQFGQPTWVSDVADQIIKFSLDKLPPKVVHAVASGSGSWFDFAKEIVGDYPISPVSSESLNRKARRPKYSVLDNENPDVVPIDDWVTRWRVAKDSVLPLS